MTLSKKIISVAVLAAFTSVTFAATDTADIIINVTKNEFINITGDIGGNPTVDLQDTEVDGVVATLGQLGVESNVAGDCTINVASDNAYQLLHTVTSTPLHGATPYSVSWAGSTFSPTATAAVVVTSCDAAQSALTMNNPAMVATEAGTYTDTLHVTVTNE